jgi:starch-binding outer membrane protein, SusD/RagB family
MKIKNIWVSLVLAVVLVSCESALDVYPFQSLEASQAIKNENDLKYAINGCYDAFQLVGYYNRSLVILSELASDNAYNGGTIIEYGQLNNHVIMEDNAVTSGIWSAIYIGINRVNTALYYMDRLDDIPQDRKTVYEAELRFMRALHYYNLAILFSDVPVRITPTLSLDDLHVPLSPQAEVLNNVVLNDLMFAREKLEGNSPMRASNAAVNALLARLHQFTGDHAEAAAFATEVIENSGMMLNPDYASLFTQEVSAESVFEIDFTAQDGNRMAQYLFPSSMAGRYEVAPEENLLEAYDPDDARKTASFELGDPNPYCIKYNDITFGSDNVYVFRLAEMYLIRAEALARSDGDKDDIRSDINTIRNRVSLDPVTADSYDELLLIIEKERRLEFAFEGHRWFDLVRTNRAVELLDPVTSTDQYYYPIPLSESNTNEAI